MGTSSSTEGARIEAPKAARGVGMWGRGVPLPAEGVWEGSMPPLQKKISILDLKWANFGANWVLFVQFT